jgi:hypothetical protein
MRPRNTSLDPVQNLLDGWRSEGLPADVEAHFLAVGRQVGRELHGASIMQRGAAAAWLTLYRRLREDASGGALTAARGLAELVRAGRALGLLRVLEPGRPGRANEWRGLPRRRAVPCGVPARFQDEREQEPDGSGDEDVQD